MIHRMLSVRIQSLLIILCLFISLAGVFWLRYSIRGAEETSGSEVLNESSSLPRLLELGSVTCVPCKLMEKVLDSLRNEYRGKLEVDFIDVGENPEAGTTHKILIIPTQIFFGTDGAELFRHEGYYAKDDIVNKWAELGYRLQPDPVTQETESESPGMLDGIFVSLARAIEGSWGMAIIGAFIWGILSILLSPCHLASIPLIVGFIDGQGRISTRRAFVIALLFSIGILVTIGLIGVFTSAAGKMLGDVGTFGNHFVASVFFLVGLHLVGVIPAPLAGPGQVNMKRRGMLAAFILGLVFGIALGPCSFAYMAPMLAITFKLAAKHLYYGILLLAIYGIGHCSVIVLAGTFTEIVQRYLNWNEASKGAERLKKACGLLVICGGLYLIYIS
jgi:cytochrome c-type biogenesis protein